MSARDKVLVIGDDTRSFLATVRSLGRQGLEVHAAPFDFGAPALASRYIATTHFLPYYLDGGLAWLDAIQTLLREHRFAMVVPCDERGLLPLCLHRDVLAPLSALAIPSPEALDIYFDKVRTRELAQSCDVAVAHGRMLAPDDSVERIEADIGLPVVIKEPMSYALPELYVRTSTRIVETRAALQAWLDKHDHGAGPILLEQMFPGAGVGVSVLCHKGAVLQAFEHQRAHELNGSGYYRKSMPLDPARLAAVERMVRASHYTGLAMFEFKVGPDGWILIEVNARPWGSLPLPVSIGVDFPYRLYLLLALGQATVPVSYPAGRYCRNLVLDMWQARSAAAGMTRTPLKLAAHCLSWAWGLHRVLIGRERQDTLVLDDPRPGLREVRELIGGRMGALRERLRPAAVPLGAGLERRLAELVNGAGGRPLEVLFICQGNINRSSYAELKAGQLFDAAHLRFSSAGMLPRNRRGSPAVAIGAAARHGVSMSAHRSRHASAELLEAADLVIAFDHINLDAVAARYPHLRHRIFLLGDVLPAGDSQIRDPEGRDETTFLTTYQRIDDCLTALARSAGASDAQLRKTTTC
ncbi:ATP-grasp domain-containing protein [Oxalobacteraceae sp. CFBP 8755]|nr:ATP-grasp domain-containing protein [Oxalobacteraceae sp. CFBP 8755]